MESSLTYLSHAMFIFVLEFKPRHDQIFAYEKTKAQISCSVTAQLISALVFATQIVKSLFFLNPKFQASSFSLSLDRLICVGPGQKP